MINKRKHAIGSVRNTVLLCIALISIVVVLFVLKVIRVPVLSPEQLQEAGVVLWPEPRALQPFELQDHRGQPFTNAQLEGRWSFAFFGFTNCPDICPTSMSEMGQANRQLLEMHPDLAEQFNGLLVTVDPERDDATQLGRYVTAFAERFTGVLGSHEALARFATDVNVAFGKIPDGDGYTVDHTGNIVIINPRGEYHGFMKMPHEAETIRMTFVTLTELF